MTTPNLIDIANKDVISISEEKSLNDAIALMREKNIRDVVVIRNSIHKFGLLTTQSLIRFKLESVDFTLPLSQLKLDTIHTLTMDKTLIDAFTEMQDIGNSNSLCLVDDKEVLRGYITYTDIISSIDPAVLMREQKIRDILWETVVRQTSDDTSALEVFEMMDSEGYDSVVVYADHKPVGIITTKDVVRLLSERADLSQAISNYMTKPLATLNEHATVKEALDFVQSKNYKRVVVSNDEGAVIGQISQRELLAKVYSRWVENLKQKDYELEDLNRVLKEKATYFEQMSEIDGLTGLHNRTKFEKSVLSEIERCKRYDEVFSIVLFDIDHFKRVNDNFGHLAGDKCLQDVAKTVRSKIRSIDLFARWGGEEFVLILPKSNVDEARQAAEKHRKALESYIFEEIGHVTCSFGVAQYMKEDSITDMIHRADTAMYKAKTDGRNQVVTCKEIEA